MKRLAKPPKRALNTSRSDVKLKCTVYLVVGPDGAVEASLDKGNLPELCKGESLEKVVIVI